MTRQAADGQAADGQAVDGQPPVLLEDLGDGIAWITLNRPEKRNAMSRAAREALVDALDQSTGTAKVIVLTGAGPAFCAGIDLTERGTAGSAAADSAAERRSTWLSVQDQIRRHPAIVIAAVNGFALGGGVTLINSSDLALAADEAQIGMPEIGFGLYPGLAGPSTQLRLNAKRAAWMILTANRISGQTAAEWGLVNRSVPAADLAGEALALARLIASRDATTLEWCKRALHEVPAHISDYSSALEYGEGIGTQIRSRTQTVASGLAAFGRGERNPGQGA
jgi:enoyl-CoA hydratase/carnithine racemase